MIYVDNIMVVYVVSVELHKVHTQEYKCNMGKNKIFVLELLDIDEVACFDEGVLACLDNSNKNDLDGYFLHENPLEYILE